jgi:hypothetical protein
VSQDRDLARLLIFCMESLQLPIQALLRRVGHLLEEWDWAAAPSASDPEPEGNPAPDLIVEQTGPAGYEVRAYDVWDLDPDETARLKGQVNACPRRRDVVWLFHGLERRAKNLEEVTRVILAQQPAFLDRGPGFIEPLTVQAVADLAGMHVSTVSRAVSGKRMQTPHGLQPLDSFVTGGTQ